MKTFFIITLTFITLAATAQSAPVRGGFLLSSLEISELDATVSTGIGLQAGIVQDHWRLGIYGMRTFNALRPGEAGKLYQIDLAAVGLAAHYRHPVGEYIALYTGLKGALGRVAREWLLSEEQQGRERANLWWLQPEAGIDIELGPRVQLLYTSGYRHILHMEALKGISSKQLQSLVNTIGVVVKW
ncbi:MAG TPA: hypothetical protein PKD70_11080 [Saprospiraceae bacterium]|nr:hypothetical protein [Saprospiraceae bacterium]